MGVPESLSNKKWDQVNMTYIQLLDKTRNWFLVDLKIMANRKYYLCQFVRARKHDSCLWKVKKIICRMIRNIKCLIMENFLILSIEIIWVAIFRKLKKKLDWKKVGFLDLGNICCLVILGFMLAVDVLVVGNDFNLFEVLYFISLNYF